MKIHHAISFLVITSVITSSVLLVGCTPATNSNTNNSNIRDTNISNTNTDDTNTNTTNQVSSGNKIDDWVYTGPTYEYDDMVGSTSTSYTQSAQPLMFDPAGSVSVSDLGVMDESLGFSVGGAKDINAFRDDIEKNYLPIHSDITYEGLFYDYFFDTGQLGTCEKLFCPSYSYAVSQDPISQADDYYLSVGLNSGIKESDFERKKLNLVVVLDISGSMGSPFDEYYYDGTTTPVTEVDEDSSKTKMELANESVVELLGHLNPDDQFGMILFDDYAYLGKPISRVGDTDMEALKGHILELYEQGGTNMTAGMEDGTALFDDLTKETGEVDPNEYENRIIFLTDAQPNTGDTSPEGMFGKIERNAENKIYTTVIGIGVDFNTDLIEQITNTYGANYYTVKSAKDFKAQMDEGFDFMVTPLVFDLALTLEANGYDIEKVYGSPDADEATGEIMSVKTLFPSKTEDGETKGGLILLKLKKTSTTPTLTLTTSYQDRYGNTDGETSSITFGDPSTNFYQNSGIRKGILLARYADLVKNWIIDEREDIPEEVVFSPAVTNDLGIIIPPDEPSLGQWERTSESLRVSEQYNALFNTFATYYESEMQAIADSELQQELDIINKLKSY